MMLAMLFYLPNWRIWAVLPAPLLLLWNMVLFTVVPQAGYAEHGFSQDGIPFASMSSKRISGYELCRKLGFLASERLYFVELR